MQETKFLSVNPTDFFPTSFLQGDKSQFIVLHAVDDSVAEEGQSFTCQLVSADNGGVLGSELDEATVYIPANDKVEGVVSIDPSARNIIAGEPMQGYDGVFVVRLVKKQDVYVPFFHIRSKVKTRFADTRLLQTPHYYGQFALSLGKENPYIFFKFNPLNTDNPLIRTLYMASSLSVLTGLEYI